MNIRKFLSRMVSAWLLFSLSILGAQTPAAPAGTVPELKNTMALIEKLHTRKLKSGPYDWLSSHHETGQDFAEYIKSDPVSPTPLKNTIYIQPIGPFTETQKKLIRLSGEFISLYFGLPLKTSEPLPLSMIPPGAQRIHPSWGDKQLLAPYILDRILKPALPEDATACLGLTAVDLYPQEDWNFVFGMASLVDRIGVWSIYRKGNPDDSPDAFKVCLRRTLHTAVHETGHMFSMLHCIKYECCMCGSNSLAEGDSLPLWLCPECMIKVCYTCKTDPLERYRSLEKFCRDQGLIREADFYRKAIILLEKAPLKKSVD